jgi:hypothetical protein
MLNQSNAAMFLKRPKTDSSIAVTSTEHIAYNLIAVTSAAEMNKESAAGRVWCTFGPRFSRIRPGSRSM